MFFNNYLVSLLISLTSSIYFLYISLFSIFELRYCCPTVCIIVILSICLRLLAIDPFSGTGIQNKRCRFDSLHLEAFGCPYKQISLACTNADACRLIRIGRLKVPKFQGMPNNSLALYYYLIFSLLLQLSSSILLI